MDNVTIYGIATLFTGVLGIFIRYCFKSKCTNVSCLWGLVAVERDTEAENRELEIELKNGVTQS
jgi:hypothetical protein